MPYISIYNTHFKIVFHSAAIIKTHFERLCAFLLFLLPVAVVEQLWSIVLLITVQHFRNNVYANYTEVQRSFWIGFLLVNSEMWIRTAIKLPHDLGVCQKTVGNSARDFYRGGERKTQRSWIRMALKSPTTPCIWWKSLTSPWETITVRIGL